MGTLNTSSKRYNKIMKTFIFALIFALTLAKPTQTRFQRQISSMKKFALTPKILPKAVSKAVLPEKESVKTPQKPLDKDQIIIDELTKFFLKYLNQPEKPRKNCFWKTCF